VLVFGHKIQGVFQHQKLSNQGVFKASLLCLPSDHMVGKLIPECNVRNTEFHPAWNSAGFAESVSDFEICAQSLNYFYTILYYFPSEQKFKEFSLFSSTFSKNSSFQGLFKLP